MDYGNRECILGTKELLDDNERGIYKMQFTSKRKLRKLGCCERNKKIRRETWYHSCNYCDCVFPVQRRLEDHIKGAHKCAKYYEFVLLKTEPNIKSNIKKKTDSKWN